MQFDQLTSDRVLRLAAETGDRPERVAVKLGLISDAELAGFYAERLGSPTLLTTDYPEQPVSDPDLRLDFFRHHRACPISVDQAGLTVALADPLDEIVVRALAFATERPVLRRVGLPTDIEAALLRLYSPTQPRATPEDAGGLIDEDRDADLERLRDLASEAPVIRLVDAVIARAVELRASDIHIEAAEAGLRVRYRIDGVLRDVEPPAARLKAAVVSRVKIMARLNIAERRLAQDGRIRQIVRGQEIDLRVSTTPAIHGESVVLPL